jgi:hypothetical protein
MRCAKSDDVDNENIIEILQITTVFRPSVGAIFQNCYFANAVYEAMHIEQYFNPSHIDFLLLFASGGIAVAEWLARRLCSSHVRIPAAAPFYRHAKQLGVKYSPINTQAN